MATFIKTIWNVEGAILLLLPIAGTAFAADDDALFRILMRADIALNFAAYCAQFDPLILQRTRGSQGDMQELSQRIRDEVVFRVAYGRGVSACPAIGKGGAGRRTNDDSAVVWTRSRGGTGTPEKLVRSLSNAFAEAVCERL